MYLGMDVLRTRYEYLILQPECQCATGSCWERVGQRRCPTPIRRLAGVGVDFVLRVHAWTHMAYGLADRVSVRVLRTECSFRVLGRLESLTLAFPATQPS